jgi:hypothetical protein
MNKNLGFKWCLIIGGFGFLAGFLGPMILAPGANQGPLVGILITGPLGFILGITGWILSYLLNWPYDFQVRVAKSCCALIALGILFAALKPKPDWPGRIFEIRVTKCSHSSRDAESILETIVLHERIIKKEISFSKKEKYSSGEITYLNSPIVRNSFYIAGECSQFPVGFTGTYFASNHPVTSRDKAVLESIPDFAKGM